MSEKPEANVTVVALFSAPYDSRLDTFCSCFSPFIVESFYA